MASDLIERCREALVFPDAPSRKLYEQAKRARWRIDHDIDWRDLDLSEAAPSIRCAMATVYAQVRYAEMFGLVHVAQALAQTDATWARLTIAAQVADEAQHVEFFSRVVTLLQVDAELSPSLIAFGHELDGVTTIEERCLGSQVLLESFAQTIFREAEMLSRRTRQTAVRFPGSAPALRLVECVTNFVARDEARHVAFGILYLKRRWPELPPAQREHLHRCAARWSALLDAVLVDIGPALARIGLRCDELVSDVRRMRGRHMRSIGMHRGNA